MKYSPVYFNLFNMESLIYNEYYTDEDVIFIAPTTKSGIRKSTISYCKSNHWSLSYEKLRIATPEEKHWLNECIRLNKYISFDEAMKTYVNQYEINLIL